jgi:hypothetical protein
MYNKFECESILTFQIFCDLYKRSSNLSSKMKYVYYYLSKELKSLLGKKMLQLKDISYAMNRFKRNELTTFCYMYR